MAYTDESAVEQILAEAMDHCVLEQIAAINCSSFSHSLLPSHLESRFQRLKTFPSSSSHPSKPHLAPDSANELNNSVNESSNSANELSNSTKPISDDFEKTPEKERNSKGKSRTGYLSSPSGSSNSSSGYLNSPKFRVKQGGKKGKNENSSISSSLSSDSSTKRGVKTGCFWCSPKRVSRKKSVTRNGDFELSDDWGKHDEIMSDLKSFSSKHQKKLMKIAKKEEEEINKEAEKIVKWAKQTSARLDFSVVNDDDLSDDNFGLY